MKNKHPLLISALKTALDSFLSFRSGSAAVNKKERRNTAVVFIYATLILLQFEARSKQIDKKSLK